MIDIVIPKGNEKELLETALKLGYSGLCFVDSDKKLPNCYSGLLNRNGKADLVLFDTDAREALEKKDCDIVFDMERSRKRDVLKMHSGFNHVLAKIAHDKKKLIGFSFSRLLKEREAMGRMMQNIKLCEKYNVGMVIASFASSPDELRNPSDLESLFRILGMKNPKKALNAAEERITLKEKKRKGIVIKEGIERV